MEIENTKTLLLCVSHESAGVLLVSHARVAQSFDFPAGTHLLGRLRGA